MELLFESKLTFISYHIICIFIFQVIINRMNDKITYESNKKIPEGYHSITPVLIVKDGNAAIEFYKKGSDVEERHRMKSPDGRVAHAELKLGDSIFMLSDEYPEMKCHSPNSIGGSPVSMYVYVEDVDELFNKAVSAGAKVLDPVKDQFWGDRHGRLEDPFGHLWSIATHKRDLSEEEMKRAAEAAFSQMSK
jgi:PhnB protein